MKQHYLYGAQYVFQEFSHNSLKSPDADDKCVHKLPYSQIASLEEHSIFQKPYQYYASHSTKCKEEPNDILFTNYCLHYYNSFQILKGNIKME